MLKTISWTEFGWTMALASALYYGYIAFTYYRKDLAKLFTAGAPRPVRAPQSPETLHPHVHDLVDELHALLSGLGKTADKTLVLFKISQLLSKYPALKDSPFTASIHQLIITKAQNECAVTLREDDLKNLWV